MLSRFKDQIRRFDWWLFTAVCLLCCLGLAAIYSVELSRDNPDFSFFDKQLTFFLIGIALCFIFSTIHYSFLYLYSQWLYAGAMVLLALVLLFGATLRGTTGWFVIGGLGFQPVELAKVALIVVLAKFFCNRFQNFNQIKHVVASGLLTIGLTGLVILQPDIGSALVLFGMWFILLLLTKIKKSFLFLMVGIVVIAMIFSWFFVFKDYQQERILSFLNPQQDPLGSGYNVRQAVIAIGAGNFWGQGLGLGSQSQLKFIPESQSDFIFAVIAEELGFVGVGLVLILFAIVFWRLIVGAQKAPDDFGQFLLLGIATVFFIHIVVNIGMNLGLMPVTGIPLPFLSYGGSFLVVSLALVGCAESVRTHRDRF
ncbi:MAG: rod shape-determining protein RodA [Candidatus Falkowbacteria bacterium]